MSLEKNKIIVGFKKFIECHWMALCFAIIIGLICILPQLVFPIQLGKDYKGLPMFYTDDEYIYLAMVKEVMEEHYLIGSPFFYEYKNTLPLVLPFGQYFYAFPGLLLGLSAIDISILLKFLFPGLLFFLVYYFTIKLINQQSNILDNFVKFSGLAGGCLAVFGYSLVDYASATCAFHSLFFDQYCSTHFLVWTRPVNPITGAILLFVFLILLYKIFNKNNYFLVILSGILLGLMIYYIFSWSIAVTILILLSLAALVHDQKKIFFSLFFVLIINFLISTPFWYNIVISFLSGDGGEFMSRNGLFYTHAPIFNKFLLLICLPYVISLVYYFVKNNYKIKIKEVKKEWVFSIIILLSCWIVFNQQLLTGRIVWPYHFVQYTIPLCMVCFIFIAYKFAQGRWLRMIIIIEVGLMLVSIFAGVSTQINTYRNVFEEFKNKQQGMESIVWLKEHTNNGGCVVLVRENYPFFSDLIPAYTVCDLYASDWAFSGVPQDRVVHNFFILKRLAGLRAEDALQYLNDHPQEIRANFFDNWNTMLGVGSNEYTKQKAAELAADYRNFMQVSLKDSLNKYRLDYILSTTALGEDLIKEMGGADLVLQNSSMFLYRLK